MLLHHVQVSVPPGGEELARRFWRDGLGLTEIAKPETLRARGGAWFRTDDPDPSPDGRRGVVAAEIHVGVETDFRPARKAHPALLLDSIAALEAVGERLEALGFDVDLSERDTFPGHVRFHAHDGHGNRVELLAAQAV